MSLKQAGHRVRTVYQYALVCQRFPHELPHPDVSYSIHREVWYSDLFTEDDITRNALDFIASKQMTVKQARAWLNKDKPAVTRVTHHATMKALRNILDDMKGLKHYPIEISKTVDKLAGMVREQLLDEKPVPTKKEKAASIAKLKTKIQAAVNFG